MTGSYEAWSHVDKLWFWSLEAGEVAPGLRGALRQPSGLGTRMLELLLAGLGRRFYERAIGQMAETVGTSKSSVSRQASKASGERLKELA